MSSAELAPARRPTDWVRVVAMAGAGLLLVWSAQTADLRPGALLDERGQANALELLEGFTHPDFTPDFVERIQRLTLESLAIGLAGMALAVALGIPLALIAARLPGLLDSPGSRSWGRRLSAVGRVLARMILSVLRSIPEIIWAFLFVRILGLGPGPAVLAIGLTFAGIIGKLYSELIEAADPRPVRALLRAGSGHLGALLHGVLPQVRGQWVGYGCFRFECSLRSASILGIVGAGGLGQEIDLSIRYFQYDKLATALLAILGCVMVLELLSMLLRRLPARWSVGLLVLGAAEALATLDIDWPAFGDPASLEQAWRFIEGFLAPTLEPAFLGRAWDLVLQTLAIAVAATAGAAALAFLLAPLAARVLTVRGYLADAPGANRPGRLLWLAPLLAARVALQVSRAIPDLVWALLFVVWVGPGPFAGALAIGAHTIGILGRLFGEVYEEAEPDAARALEAAGAGRLGTWAFGVLPQVRARLLSYSLFRFEVNVRATAMVGFVGAGGIGDAIHTAISLFHMQDLAALLMVLLAVVLGVDALGHQLRRRLLDPAG